MNGPLRTIFKKGQSPFEITYSLYIGFVSLVSLSSPLAYSEGIFYTLYMKRITFNEYDTEHLFDILENGDYDSKNCVECKHLQERFKKFLNEKTIKKKSS